MDDNTFPTDKLRNSAFNKTQNDNGQQENGLPLDNDESQHRNSDSSSNSNNDEKLHSASNSNNNKELHSNACKSAYQHGYGTGFDTGMAYATGYSDGHTNGQNAMVVSNNNKTNYNWWSNNSSCNTYKW